MVTIPAILPLLDQMLKRIEAQKESLSITLNTIKVRRTEAYHMESVLDLLTNRLICLMFIYTYVYICIYVNIYIYIIIYNIYMPCLFGDHVQGEYIYTHIYLSIYLYIYMYIYLYI